MGVCKKCGAEVSLSRTEIECENCNEELTFVCHDCHNEFSVGKFKDEKDKKQKLRFIAENKDIPEKVLNEIKEYECKFCGFFVCPHCGVCGKGCSKHIYVQKLISWGVTVDNATTFVKDISEELKQGVSPTYCPKGVPYSYAKTEIKTLWGRMFGIGVKKEDGIKDEEDVEAFNKKLEDIENMEIGQEITAVELRPKGEDEKLYRTALNVSVCFGLVKKEILQDEKDKNKKYERFIRIEGERCPNCDINKGLVWQCPKKKEHKKQFTGKIEEVLCYDCKPYKKNAKRAGLQPIMNLKKTNAKSCIMSRSEFIILDEFKKLINRKETKQNNTTTYKKVNAWF